MSGLDWIIAAWLAVMVLTWMESRYRLLDAQLISKLKLDEAQAECLDRICCRLEEIQQEIAEANAMMADDSDDDEDDVQRWEPYGDN